jgi:hypothetical protein
MWELWLTHERRKLAVPSACMRSASHRLGPLSYSLDRHDTSNLDVHIGSEAYNGPQYLSTLPSRKTRMKADPDSIAVSSRLSAPITARYHCSGRNNI